MEIKWTEDQKNIIDERDKNILVSASAGSGKTTVMIHRIINLVLDEKQRTPISKFLVVTFTKASAADMKKKLIEAFMQYPDDEFCLEQIDDVASSDISNLHSFCSRLISTYFYEVNVDPSFQVLDGAISEYLQDKALDKLFDKKEKEGDSQYFRLFDIFQKKRQNKELKNIIKRFNNFLNANLDAEKWFFDSLDQAYNDNLSQNSCAKIINSFVPNRILELCEQIENFAIVCKDEGLEELCDYFMDVSLRLKSVNLHNSFEVNARNIYDISLAGAPRISSKVVLKPQIDEMKKSISKQIENFEKNYICPDVEFLKQGLTKMKTTVLSLYNLVKEFNQIYDDLKKDINGLDFNDLEKNALKILSNDQILQSLKEKYRYIFVDEYQDINSVQEKIISLLSGENNRFMVGDIKQSIYRFRLCDPDIFLKKYEEYGNGEKFSKLYKLNCNFRSDKKILKFVDKVFAGVMTEDFGGIDYAKDSVFVAGEDNLDKPNSVNLCLIDTPKSEIESSEHNFVYSVKNHVQPVLDDEERGIIEARLVADKIAKLKLELGDDFHYSDFAVLVGSRNAMVLKFIDELKNYGILVSSDEKYNLMDKVYIQEILNFVKLACNSHDDFMLFKVLKSRFFNFSDNDLVKIRLCDAKARFYECVKLVENIDDAYLKERLTEFNSTLEKYSKLAKVLTIKQLCKKIIEDFSVYQINNASNEVNANENIDLMINSLPETDAFDFVLNFENFALEVENECGGDTVSVMTIHKSKGIEFKYVFLINTTNEFNFESTRTNILFNKNFGVGIDYFDEVNRTQIETIASSGIKLLEKRKLVEEQQRVLYVALTRAKEKLFVICSKDKNKIMQNAKLHKKCYFDWFEPIVYNELNGRHDEIINFEEYKASELAIKNEKNLREILFKDYQTKEPDWFDYKHSDAKKFSLKTSISKILKNEETFNENLSETIAYSNSSADRGTAYHKVLQEVDFKNKDIAGQFENLQKLDESKMVDFNIIQKLLKMSIFDEISRANYILTEKEFYAKLSTDIIEKSNAEGSFVLQGVIDLIAIFDDYAIVLDYKTGKMNDEKLKKYSFQLNTYADIVKKIYEIKSTKNVLCFIDEQKIIEI